MAGLFARSEKGVLTEEIKGLRRDLADLKIDKEAMAQTRALTGEIVSLKRQITDLEVSRSKLEEKNKRELREVEHQVGLQRKRGEFEIDAAKRSTELDVREANLAAERDRFEKAMEFQQEQMNAHASYLETLMVEVLKRLPTIEFASGLVPGPARSADAEEE